MCVVVEDGWCVVWSEKQLLGPVREGLDVPNAQNCTRKLHFADKCHSSILQAVPHAQICRNLIVWLVPAPRSLAEPLASSNTPFARQLAPTWVSTRCQSPTGTPRASFWSSRSRSSFPNPSRSLLQQQNISTRQTPKYSLSEQSERAARRTPRRAALG